MDSNRYGYFSERLNTLQSRIRAFQNRYRTQSLSPEWKQRIGTTFLVFGSLASGLLASRNSELTAIRSWELKHSPPANLRTAAFASHGFRAMLRAEIQERVYRKIPSRTDDSRVVWFSQDGKWIAWIPEHAESPLPEVYYRGTEAVQSKDIPNSWDAYPGGWKGFELILSKLDSLPKPLVTPALSKKAKIQDPRALFY